MSTKLSIDYMLNRANSLVKKGDIDIAEEIYQTILKSFPLNLRAKRGLSILDESKQKNIITNQNPPEDVENLLNYHFNQGDFAIVIEKSQFILRQYPNAFVVWNIVGASAVQMGDLELGVDCFRKVISLKPNHIQAYNNLAVTLLQKGHLKEALLASKKALLLNPNYAEAYSNMANILKAQGALEEAIVAYQKAISLKPCYPEAYNNLAITLLKKGDFEASLKASKKSLLFKPNNAEAFSNIANVLKEQGNLVEALSTYQKEIAVKPHNTKAYNNIGIILHQQGKLASAISSFYKSIELAPLNPEAHLNLSFSLLNHGKIKEGLAEYEWRWKSSKFFSQYRCFSKPRWDRKLSLINKKLLLWSEQGIGDTLRWSSCLNFLSNNKSKIILECKEKLVPLLKRSFPDIEIKAENKKNDLQRNDLDFHLPMGSLYNDFFNDIINNYKIDPYLIPDPIIVNFWRKRLKLLGEGPYIGISWKSSDMKSHRIPNYAPISNWYKILKITNITFINLQYINFKDDLEKVKNEIGVKVHNFSDLDQYENIDDVSALCAALDMVVSHNNTVHLISSGVGTTTKLANWKQSSWNNFLFAPPTSNIDIFERNTWESWDNVFELIAEDIKKFKNVYED